MVARSHQHRSRAAEEYRSRAAGGKSDEPAWMQEWADGELVEQIELLMTRVEHRSEERAELSRAPADASKVAASYALPGMADIPGVVVVGVGMEFPRSEPRGGESSHQLDKASGTPSKRVPAIQS